MILSVLSILSLKLHSHLSLVQSLFVQFLASDLQLLDLLLELFLGVCLLLKLGSILGLQLVPLILVLLRNLLDEHSVISSAAILKKN